MRHLFEKKFANYFLIAFFLLGGFFLAVNSAQAADTGFIAPTESANSTPTGWDSPNNAFTSDDVRAQANATTDIVEYYGFNLNVPTNATITGVEARVEGFTSNASRQIITSLSWNNGSSFTTTTKTTALPATANVDGVSTLGGSSDTWGRAWTPNDFSNFRFRLQASSNAGAVNVDYVQIKVYYTVPDTTAPVITAHANVNAVATALGGATVIYTLPTANDNIDGPVTVNCLPASGGTFPIGITPITCNAHDVAGNNAASSFNVIVTPAAVSASVSSVATSPNSVSTNGGSAIITVVVKDAFGNPISGISPSDINIAVSGLGNTITPQTTATNAQGVFTATLHSNYANTKTVTVTVNGVELNDKPTVTFTSGPAAKATITANPLVKEANLLGSTINLDILVTDASGNIVSDDNGVWVTPTTAAQGTIVSSCTNSSQAYTKDGHVSCNISFNYKGIINLAVSAAGSGSLAPQGNTTIQFTDTTKPVIAAHGDESFEATSHSGAVVTYTNPTATDNIDGALVTTCLPASGSTLALGIHTVTCSAKDGSNNTETSTFTVEVKDTVQPTIIAPADITNEATGPQTAVVLGAPVVGDIADAAPIVTSDAPATFPLGETTVTWTVTDHSHNSQTATQKVTIVDTTKPVIAAHADVTGIEAVTTAPETGTTVTYTAPVSSDLVDGNIAATCLPASGSVFALGTTQVKCNITDAHGNGADETTFNVTVVDTTDPVISAVSPSNNAYLKSDFSVSYTVSEPLSSGYITFDNVDGAFSYSLTGSDLTIGAHTLSRAAMGLNMTDGVYFVDVHGQDPSGNVVTVTNTNITYDTIAPTILNITSDKADGTYKAGETISIAVKFSEVVNATTYYRSAGCGIWYGSHCWDEINQRPYITLETGNNKRNAYYVSGTGTDTLIFAYTVQAGDTAADLDYLSTNAIGLDSQSIRDLSGNNANLTLATPGTAGSLGANKNIVIDTTAPTVVLSTAVVSPTNYNPFAVTATFSEAVTGFELSDITIGNGAASDFVAVSPTVYTFNVVPTTDGDVTVDIAAAAALDAAGNANTAATQLIRLYDASAPTVSAIELKEGNNAYDGVVKAGDVLTIKATFSEALAEATAPTVVISGSNTATAAAMTRVDATHYTYNYTVVTPGDGDATITIAGGTDLANNTLVSNSATTFVVDNTKPVIAQRAAIIETANSLGGKVVTYEVTATDNHDAILNVTCSPASGTKFNVSQTTTVTCNTTDLAGNAAEAMTFDVTVNPDAITKLFVSGVTPVKTNEASTITVKGKDVYGNVTTNQSGSTIILSADNGGDLNGNTILTLTNGVAETSLRKTTVGVSTVTAVSGTLTPANAQVTFTAVDTTGPVVTSVSPEYNSVDVAISAPLFINFDEALSLANVNSTNVQLWKAAVEGVDDLPGTPAVQVPATVSLVEGGKRINITPASALSYGAAYYFVVNNSITDETGNALTTTKDNTNTGFRTVADTTDRIAPMIVAHAPTGNDVAINAKPTVTFSEALKLSTVNSTNVQLLNGDAPVAAIVSLVEGGTQIMISPTSPLAYSTAYRIVVNTNIADETGNVLAAAGDYTFTTTQSTADVTAPTVTGHNPNTEVGVAVDVKPTISFSEILKVSTVNSENVILTDSQNNVVPAIVSLVEGGTQIMISPTSPLAFNTNYSVTVANDVTDEAGNRLADGYSFNFTTAAENVQFAVTNTELIKSFASPDNSFANGWKWRLTVTVPTTENELRMKFTDFVGTSTSTITANANIRFSSPQSASTPVVFNSADLKSNGFSNAYLNLTGDMDATAPGRQIQVIVEVKVPNGTQGGAYSNSYEFESSESIR